MKKRITEENPDDKLRSELEDYKDYLHEQMQPKKKESCAEKKKTQTAKLIELADNLLLFHDETREPYAWINNEAMSIKGCAFQEWLTHAYWVNENTAPSSQVLKSAIMTISAKAVYEGQCYTLHNRVAMHDGAIYYDLGEGQVIQTTECGWQITKAPILFKRFQHQQKQVEPVRGASIERLFNYINVKDSFARLLIVAALVTSYVPDIPHPILFPHGDQGSGKTTMSAFLKSLIDPSKIEVTIPPVDKNEVIQILDHNYFSSFDNLSKMPGWFSDLLAVAVTGGGISKRKLYTNGQDYFFNFKRCLCLNGISMVIKKPDLLDRSILISFTRIDPSKRKEMSKVRAEFEKDKSFILGGIFDVLADAMRIYPSIKLSSFPRMADFFRWGCAVTEALGYERQDFFDGIDKNIKKQNAEVIDVNALAQAILTLMDDVDSWEGTIKSLLLALRKIANPSTDDGSFPRHANKVRQHLDRIKANLLDFGIRYKIEEFHRRQGVCAKIWKESSQSSHVHQANNINNLDTEDSVNVRKYVHRRCEDMRSTCDYRLHIHTPSSQCNLLNLWCL